MKLQQGMTALVTGGASGLGEASVHALLERGLNVVAVDLNDERGQALEQQYPGRVRYVKADVSDAEQMAQAIATAEDFGDFRALVHCAGIGGPLRLIEKDGSPGSLDKYVNILRVNLIGTFNVLRLAAVSMAKNEPIDGERGACVLTASVAGYEGQIGQIPYASSKAGVIGMTIVAARDLASKFIRVCTIAPGLFDTPILAKLPENVRQSLGASVPHPARLGHPNEYALTALHILENPMLNGETIRLDGAIRMQPR
ncbi:SDR family NAD(P)-dependent oxidoreductase [Acidovorax sp. Be4]|jgi:NAD(P)-dependent dehydrogenase (short-subunit alcohol dehydrogenase family)|uniref:SDR family NAD(P)-dependent oxidoreductase n=1 Tax=Acidovorax bellezanensis TaxID=2976702 RepID=A0ABT2PMC0_9BURK|nr:SDR family NAD(P)-dependent oxidoreductase [Acidovorax sp. Be4]MCT9811619.1 SDR family NAD(P)-dependent oxidoreductase [Acidovorax sp. Be4]